MNEYSFGGVGKRLRKAMLTVQKLWEVTNVATTLQHLGSNQEQV